MLNKNKQEIELIDRLTIASPDISFSSVPEAIDYFESRETRTSKAFGSELRVCIDGGSIFLLIKKIGQINTYKVPIRDSGLEGILMRNGMGMGAFPMTIADNKMIEWNINYLFENIMPNEEFTLIGDVYQGKMEIKSIMSGKFGHIDNLDVLKVISELDIPYEIQNLSLNKDFFRINVVNPANKVEVKVGDISSIGLDLLNSETGKAFLKMGEYIYRYWCTNGCSHIDKNSEIRTKAMHLGNSIHEVLKQFRSSAMHYLTTGADIIKKNIEILAETSVTDNVLNKVTDKVEKVIGIGNTERFVNNWELFTGIKESHESEWNGKKMVEYENNTDSSAWNLAQLVTFTAKDKSFFNMNDSKSEKKVVKNLTGKQLQLEGIGGWMYHNASQLV